MPYSFKTLLPCLFNAKINKVNGVGRCHMAIKANNLQVYTTLSKEPVVAIDAYAKENFHTRSQQINMILTEYYKTESTTERSSK